MKDRPIHCTFCTKSSDEVLLMVKSDVGVICNECIRFCQAILDEFEEKEQSRVRATANFPCGSLGEAIECPPPAPNLDRLLARYILGQRPPLSGTDYRILRAAGYIAPAARGWTLTEAGQRRWSKDD